MEEEGRETIRIIKACRPGVAVGEEVVGTNPLPQNMDPATLAEKERRVRLYEEKVRRGEGIFELRPVRRSDLFQTRRDLMQQRRAKAGLKKAKRRRPS